ncbi:MAG: type II toxin-antitoxin system PemK/MazF family toxin [Planctomycetes bacterium]|nr:type II toxin-antitoxin system PemK/MazF family toxin [Planctomycetota bacterium]
MPEPRRGEVWIVDLGYQAKTRPCAVLSVPVRDNERALVSFVPRTTQVRGTRFEVASNADFFDQQGVFDAQAIDTIDRSKLRRRIGALTSAELHEVENAVKRWLGFEADPGSASPPQGPHERDLGITQELT